jgi:hypothetical protein
MSDTRPFDPDRSNEDFGFTRQKSSATKFATPPACEHPHCRLRR